MEELGVSILNEVLVQQKNLPDKLGGDYVYVRICDHISQIFTKDSVN